MGPHFLSIPSWSQDRSFSSCSAAKAYSQGATESLPWHPSLWHPSRSPNLSFLWESRVPSLWSSFQTPAMPQWQEARASNPCLIPACKTDTHCLWGGNSVISRYRKYSTSLQCLQQQFYSGKTLMGTKGTQSIAKVQTLYTGPKKRQEEEC